MKRTIKLLAVLFALILTFGIFAGCDNTAKDKETAAPTEKAETQKPEATEAPAEEETAEETEQEQITLDMWHIWTTDADPQKAVLEFAVDKIVEEFPNISIELTATENDTYKTVLPTALATNEAPDIFYYWGAGMAQAVVEAGQALDITSYYEGDADLQAKLPKGALAYTTFNDKIYGYTYSLNVGILYCNQEIFDTNGVKIPETYDEMLAASKALSGAGIVPMSVGGASLWPALHQLGGLAVKEVGSEACNKALIGEAKFNTPEFIEAARKIQELAAAGMYSDSIMSVDYDTSVAAFQDGEAAMLYMGSWAIGGVDEKSEAAVAGKIVAMPWPNSVSAYDNDFFGGSVDSFYISSQTEYPDECAAVLSMLCETLSVEGFKRGVFLPIWTIAGVDAEASDLFKSVQEMTSAAKGYTLWWDTSLGSEKGNKCNEYVASLIVGDITPEQFVEAMDALIAQ